MTETNPSPTDQAPTESAETLALLRRVLAAVENDRRRGRLELVLAIILSLATLASTWCAYQAKLWGGVQGGNQAKADTAERQAAEDTIVGLQTRTFDVIEIGAYWAALRQKDTESSEAIFVRMRPRLRTAVEASLAAGVLHNPAVVGPLQRPEYIIAEEVNAKRLREEAARLQREAKVGGQASGTYVLLTLVFASVLFFGGITGTFKGKRVQFGLGCIALLLFLVTMVFLAELPVCKG